MAQVSLKGSCLCGAVKYEITGQAERFYHCHCQRCRKASGSGHASNLLMTPLEGITWTQGKDKLARYKVPEAERFFNCFCTQCGSSMPREVPMLKGVLIPAGSLDDETPIKPSARIFWGSRAQWSCEDELPVFDEYP
jgi:hypothetical protein